MFQVPDTMQSHWSIRGKPKATADEIARIETAIGLALPAPYITFVTRFGFVVFDRVPGMRRLFDYAITFPDRKEVREGNISFLVSSDRLITSYQILTTPEVEDDDELPKFPANFLPVGNDAGQGKILLQLDGSAAGRVWYWPENEWAWGKEDNTWLGFVADDFYAFINGLRT